MHFSTPKTNFRLNRMKFSPQLDFTFSGRLNPVLRTARPSQQAAVLRTIVKPLHVQPHAKIVCDTCIIEDWVSVTRISVDENWCDSRHCWVSVIVFTVIYMARHVCPFVMFAVIWSRIKRYQTQEHNGLCDLLRPDDRAIIITGAAPCSLITAQLDTLPFFH